MKKFTVCFLISLIYLFPQNNEEFRSTWVITWEHINRFDTAEQNKARVRDILDKHAAANMNAVLWQARQSGTAYYNSSYEPWGYYAGYSNPGYDPLEYAIEEAHKRGLELHAWFNVFHVSSTFPGTIANQHPEWICTNIDGEFMTSYRCASPGIAAVREYTINVAMEIVRNYDIDGLHLDFIRWNEYDEDDMNPNLPEEVQISVLDGQKIMEKEFSGQATEGYKRYIFDAEHPYSGGVPAGFGSWDEWRRWGVTEFVRVLHDSIQAVKPYVRLTPAALGKYKTGGVNGWNGYYVVFQDAALWFNEGYVDQLTPMHYHWTTGAGFLSALTVDWEPNIQPGIAEGRLYSVGPPSYRLHDENLWFRHPEIVEAVRTKPWTDGFQFFSYGSWDARDYWEEASQQFFAGKSKIRPIKTEIPPGAPSISITKIDSLNYDLTVTPPAGTDDDGWFLIYRSEDDNYSPDDDFIVDISFGSEEYTYREDFADAVFFTGKYKYFATAANRYWNESGISNIVESDSVSFSAPAPVTPQFTGVVNVDNTTLMVMCESTEFATGYTAYISEDGATFDDSVVSSAPNILVNDLIENRVYYFKVRAFNDRGYSLLNDRVSAGVPSSSSHKVLVVNGFDRSTNTRHDYVRFYAPHLIDNGYPFSYVLNEAVYQDKISLNDYETVVWILGDESTDDETFSSDEQQRVITFLRSGGNLFVSGAEIGWDLEGKTGHPTAADKAFYNNYLKAKYIADAPGGSSGTYYTAQPIAGGVFNGVGLINFDNGTHGTIDVDWPDAIDGINGGIKSMIYTGAPASSNIAGVVFKGLFPSGIEEGALVHLAFPFETIYDQSKRNQLMERVLNYFYPLVSVDQGDIGKHLTYSLNQNYPNPFNPTTRISYSLIEPGKVSLRIYNLLGEEIAELIDREMPAGEHEIVFDGSNLSSGMYIYRIDVENKFSDVKKMMLMK